MKKRAVFLAAGLATMCTVSGFSQVRAAQNRISQSVVINGQTVNGAYVITAPGGQLQSFTCAAPQHYVTSDGASQGWACYEETTGVWLLNSLPPASTQSAPVPVPSPQPQPPAVIYQQAPPPAVIYQAPPTVIYQQPQPTIVYQAPPTVVYTTPAPVVVAPTYPSSVVLGTAAIRAAGQIASAAIINSHRHYREYYYYPHDRGRRW